MYQVEVTIDGVVYPSYEPAAKALGCTVGNLWFARKAIGDEVVLFGKKVTFRDNSRTTPNSKAKPVRCLETGEIFPSIAAATLACGLRCPQNMSEAIKWGRRAGGYHWEFVVKEKA